MPKAMGPVGVFVAVYGSEEEADAALKEVDSLSHKDLVLDVYDEAKVVRREDGKVEVRPAHGTRSGAKAGAVAGAVVGLLFPPSILVAGAVGAAGGAAARKLKTTTLEKGFLGDLGEAMQTGRSAVVIITDAHHLETVAAYVPRPLKSASQAFASNDSDEIRDWLSSLVPQPKVAEEAPPASS
jgi:uncharacterized membrane protein